MNLRQIELINILSEKIKESDVYKEYLNSEKEIENSEEVALLSYKKDMALVQYEDALRHFDKNSKEVLEASRHLSKAIFSLNNHELVVKYNKKLANLNYFLNEINKELFGEIYD